MIIALLFALAGQTAADAPTTQRTPAIIDPTTTTTTAVGSAPAPTTSPPRPPSPSLSPSRVIAADPRAVADDVTTTFAQVGVGLGASCVASCVALPLALVPVAGGLLYNGAIGVVTGAAEGFVGDAIGRKRGPLIVPVIVGAGVSLVGTASAMIWDALVPVTATNSIVVGQFEGRELRLGIVSTAIVAVATVATVVVPALVYQGVAVDKAAGDRGDGLPGLFAPANPTGTRAQP